MTTYLLIEDGTYLLKEDGDRIILVETTTITSSYEIKFVSINPTLKLDDNDFIIKNLNTSYPFNSTDNNFIITSSNSNNLIIKGVK